MKKLLCGLLLAACAVIGPANAQDAPETNLSGVGERVDMPAANWLFVQVADSFTSDGKSITLKGIAPQTLMFTDRPERMTGDALTAKFVEFWTKGKDDFEKDPPNATLSIQSTDKTALAVVELKNPRIDGDALTYDYRILEGTVPASGKEISLFIDWWYGPGPGPYWGGPGPWRGGYCWRGPWGGLHCRPRWGW